MRKILYCGLILVAALGQAQARTRHGPAPVNPPTAADVAQDTSALAGPLAVGATVRDPAGEVLGRITRLTTARDGGTLVMVRKGVDSFAVPADRLRVTPQGVVSSLDRQGIKALGDSATR
ncbi:MAG: hypothetical protein JSR86_10775 [Proteobacteria bacterium]|nr:hypothetical protein [Pseudomonadota bacterium]